MSLLRPEEVLKCPHCGADPTSTPVIAGELTANLQSDEVVTYCCEACGQQFSVEERLVGPRPYRTEVLVSKGDQT